MSEKPSALSVILKIMTGAFAVAIAAFVIFFGIHLYRSTIYDMFDEAYFTDDFKAAYSNSTNIRTHDVGTEGLSQNGVIKITNLIYIEKLDEESKGTGRAYMQFGVRINKLHVEEVQEVCPGVDYDDISFHLVGKSEGETVYEGTLSSLDKGEKFQYVFYKFEANDVLISCDNLYIEMRIDGITVSVDEDNDKVLIESEGAVHVADSEEIHRKDRKSVEYKLSRKEKKELGI